MMTLYVGSGIKTHNVRITREPSPFYLLLRASIMYHVAPLPHRQLQAANLALSALLHSSLSGNWY